MAYIVIRCTEAEMGSLADLLFDSGVEPLAISLVGRKDNRFTMLDEAVRRGTGRTTDLVRNVVSNVGRMTNIGVICADMNEARRIKAIVLQAVRQITDSVAVRDARIPALMMGGSPSIKPTVVEFIPSTINPQEIAGQMYDMVLTDHWATETNPEAANYIYNMVRR